MSEIKEAKVRFLSLSSLQTSRGGLLLAESALFTLPSLLFAADSGERQGAIAFFSSLYAFCHLADLRFFVLFPQLLASSAFSGASRAFPQTSTHSPATSSPCSSTQAPSALERKIFLRRRGFRLASTLRHQGDFAEEHAAVALVAAKKNCSVSEKDVVKN